MIIKENKEQAQNLEITKEDFLFKLRAISREMTCMSDTRFKEAFKNGAIKWDQFWWGKDPIKMKTCITMEKTRVDE